MANDDRRREEGIELDDGQLDQVAGGNDPNPAADGKPKRCGIEQYHQQFDCCSACGSLNVTLYSRNKAICTSYYRCDNCGLTWSWFCPDHPEDLYPYLKKGDQ